MTAQSEITEEAWSNYFSDLSHFASPANIVTVIRKKLEDEWDGKPVENVLGSYETFFQPEIDEESRIIEPWFLRLFGVQFEPHPSDYFWVLKRLETGRNVSECTITLSYFNNLFSNVANKVDEILQMAEEMNFYFKRVESVGSEITLENPETIREKIIKMYEDLINSMPPRNNIMNLTISLSNGVPFDYFLNQHSEYNKDFLFDKLGVDYDPQYGTIKRGGLIDKLYNLFYIIKTETVPSFLGIENPASIETEYIEKAFESFQQIEHKTLKEWIRQLVKKANSYSQGFYYIFNRKNENSISELCKTFSATPKKLFSTFAPLLYYGLLSFDGDSIRGWRGNIKEELWQKI